MGKIFPADILTVEIFTTASNNFVLGLSMLGFETLGGPGLTPSWRKIQCDANRTTIRRGGQVSGASTDLDTGTFAITLVNENNPIYDPGILPAIPVRVRATQEGQTVGNIIFTGTIQDVVSRYDKEGNAFTTLTGSDCTRKLRNTMIYGDHRTDNPLNQVSERTFSEVITSLRNVHGVSGSWKGSIIPTAEDLTSPIINTITTTASNTSRWGTNPTGVTPAALSGTTSVTIRDNAVPASTRVELSAYGRGVQTLLSGLEVGKTYFVTASISNFPTSSSNDNYEETAPYALGVLQGAFMNWGPEVECNDPVQTSPGGGGSWRAVYPYVSFKATATSHAIRLTRTYTGPIKGTTESVNYLPEDIILRSLTVRRTSSGGRWRPLQDVNYESNAYNQIKMAADSAKVDWWVDANNFLGYQAVESYTPFQMLFSDNHDDPDHICYTEVDVSYDTQNTVNSLRIENHGTKVHPEKDAEYLVRDTEITYQDGLSISKYEVREDRVDLRIAPWAEAERAAEILAASSTPRMGVESITVNTLEHREIFRLDLFSRIRVKFKNLDYEYNIVGINHDINPNSWFTTFTLRRYQG